MKRTDVSYSIIQGAAKLAGSGILMVCGWWFLDAIRDHFGMPVTYFVAGCAIVFCGALWVDEVIEKADRADPDSRPRGAAGEGS